MVIYNGINFLDRNKKQKINNKIEKNRKTIKNNRKTKK
jgi:hypothetical protein